jgi:hypothetical protein
MSESLTGVASVAEGLILGVAAAAQTDGRTACEAEDCAGGVDNLEVAFNADGTVAETGDFGCGHLLDGSIARRDALPDQLRGSLYPFHHHGWRAKGEPVTGKFEEPLLIAAAPIREKA